MKKFTVNYKGTDYTVNAGLKSIFNFEECTKKFFEIKDTKDYCIYVFSIMWTSEDFKDKWEDFLEFCDDNPDFVNDVIQKIPKKMGNSEAPTM